MTKQRLIAGAIAGILGVIVAIAAVFLVGAIASNTSPSTNQINFDPKNGALQGTVQYGTRTNSGVNS